MYTPRYFLIRISARLFILKALVGINILLVLVKS